MKKKIFINIAIILGIIFIILFSCTMPNRSKSYGNKNSNNEKQNYENLQSGNIYSSQLNDALANFYYPYGLKYASNEAGIDALLQAEYERWKDAYITDEGANGHLRVKRDDPSHNDTVSEGIAYGLLLSVYFDDRETFDGLYKYCEAHFIEGKGLMHWKVSAEGENISEFRLKVPHGIPYMLKEHWKLADEERTYVTERELPGVSNNPDYLKAMTGTDNSENRQLGSATDADVDIAAALIFASKRWYKQGTIDYIAEASKQITNLLQHDIDDGLIKNGSQWGGFDGWNPCYFTPAWYRLYKKFIEDNKIMYNRYSNGKSEIDIRKCNKVLSTMYEEMAIIDEENGTSGLFPDWVDTNDRTVKKSFISDRLYYLDETGDESGGPDGKIDDRADPIGVIDENDAYRMMSFNYYYDAVRVPWRLALDYSWYKDENAYNMTMELANFFKEKEETLVDGYSLDDDQEKKWAWKWEDRDGFNNGVGGKYYSTTFVAMNACAVMVDFNDKTGNAKDYYNAVVKKHDYDLVNKENTHHYYGNTVRLLALLYLSGRFINYYDLSNHRIERKPANNFDVGPLTIDLAYDDYGIYGTHHADFHDRAILFNADATGYGNIGAGIKDKMIDDQMILGVMAEVGDVMSGNTEVDVRHAIIHGNIVARGEVTGNITELDGHLFENLNTDPGCMDFKVEMSKFTPDLNNNQTIGNGSTNNLGPGDYGNININSSGNLILKSGTYNINSLNCEPDAKISFDTSLGPVVLFIKESINIKSRTQMVGYKDGAETYTEADKILIVCGTKNTIYIAPETTWNGTLVAPNSTYVNVDLRNTERSDEKLKWYDEWKAKYDEADNYGDEDLKQELLKEKAEYWDARVKGEAYGAFWGRKVVVHQGTIINHIPFNWDSLITD